MLGLTDWFHAMARKRNKRNPDKKVKIVDLSIKGADNTWFYFLPSTVFDLRILRTRLFSKEESSVIYRLPKDVVSTNPAETREILEEAYEDSVRKVHEKDLRGIISLGVSLGNAPAYKLANNSKCQRLVSIVPGANLPYCISQSIATRHIFKEAVKQGLDIRNFREELDCWSPTNNIRNLPENITIHLGLFDKMIPYHDGIELIKKLKNKGYNPKVKERYFCGHSLTVALFRNKD